MDNKDMLQEEKEYLGILDEKPTQDTEAEDAQATEDEQEDVGQEAEADDVEAVEEGSDKRVPLKALSEERKEKRLYKERAIELEKQVAVANDRVAQLQEKLENLISALTNPQDVEEEIDDSPLSRVERLEKQAATLAKQLEETKKQKEAETVQNQVVARYTESAREFAKKTPDFMDAYQHLISSRAEELKELGFSDQDIDLKLKQDEFNIAVSMLQQGKDPAQAVYNLAIKRGYRKKERKQVEAPATLANSRGSATRVAKKDIGVKEMAQMDDEAFRKLMLGE